MGGSYEGYTALMSTVHPHPALKAGDSVAPMVDGWIGDDWFHNGAFRQDGSLDYCCCRKPRAGATSGGGPVSAIPIDSICIPALRPRPPPRMAWNNWATGVSWRRIRPMTVLAESGSRPAAGREPLTVPMMLVCGLFDQEDIYGGPAVYRALAPKDPLGQMVHLVFGPWNHGGGRRDGRAIGPFQFAGDTPRFRRSIMQPFLDYYLKDGPKPDTPRVLAYETGADVGTATTTGRLPAPRAARKSRAACTCYRAASWASARRRMGAPVRRVPVGPRQARTLSRVTPHLLVDSPDSSWGEWLMDDQRNAAARPDVLVYETEPLPQPLRIAGCPGRPCSHPPAAATRIGWSN